MAPDPRDVPVEPHERRDRGAVLAPVPTLGQWAMIALTGLLTIGAFLTLRRRQLAPV